MGFAIGRKNTRLNTLFCLNSHHSHSSHHTRRSRECHSSWQKWTRRSQLHHAQKHTIHLPHLTEIILSMSQTPSFPSSLERIKHNNDIQNGERQLQPPKLPTDQPSILHRQMPGENHQHKAKNHIQK